MCCWRAPKAGPKRRCRGPDIWLDMDSNMIWCGFHMILYGLHRILDGFHMILYGSHLILYGFHMFLYGFHLTLYGFHLILSGFHRISSFWRMWASIWLRRWAHDYSCGDLGPMGPMGHDYDPKNWYGYEYLPSSDDHSPNDNFIQISGNFQIF